jgi:hypothetical protein
MLPIHFGPWQTIYRWFRELARGFLFFPVRTKIFAGDAGGLTRATSPPARAIVARQGRDAIDGSVGAQQR